MVRSSELFYSCCCAEAGCVGDCCSFEEVTVSSSCAVGDCHWNWNCKGFCSLATAPLGGALMARSESMDFAD